MPCVSQNASWTGDNSPGAGVTPSMVVIVEPSACGANIRHERTAAPSHNTVQAPQTVSSMRMARPFRIGFRIGDGARGESGCGAPAIRGRGMQVVERFDIGERVAHRVGDLLSPEHGAGQRLLRGAEADRGRGCGTDADGDATAF